MNLKSYTRGLQKASRKTSNACTVVGHDLKTIGTVYKGNFQTTRTTDDITFLATLRRHIGKGAKLAYRKQLMSLIRDTRA